MALTAYKEKRNFIESPEPTVKRLKRIKEKVKGIKVTHKKMKVAHKQDDTLMDMLKASLAGKKSKSA